MVKLCSRGLLLCKVDKHAILIISVGSAVESDYKGGIPQCK